jgi:hypothetical protein
VLRTAVKRLGTAKGPPSTLRKKHYAGCLFTALYRLYSVVGLKKKGIDIKLFDY